MAFLHAWLRGLRHVPAARCSDLLGLALFFEASGKACYIMVMSEIPDTTTVPDTVDRPQHHIGNCIGLCITLHHVGFAGHFFDIDHVERTLKHFVNAGSTWHK